MNKYKVKKGDSWIKIANDHGISVDDLFYWNGIDTSSGIPEMQLNREIYTSNPYKLNPSYVAAQAPRNYADYGEQGRQKIDMYAYAVKQGKMKFNDVPKPFQTAVNQRMITQGTDKFANHAFNTGVNIAMFLANPAAYLAGTTAQKGTAYVVDKTSGRDDYGVGDVFNYTPIMGRAYQAENPGKSAAIDIATGVFGGGLLRNLKNIANPAWRQLFAQAAKSNLQNTIGLFGQVVHENPIYNIVKGHIYQSGSKGFGKSGNWMRGNPSMGYRAVSTPKATFTHKAGTNLKLAGNQTIIMNPGIQMPAISIEGAYPGIAVPPPVDPQITVVSPERYIYEQQPFNTWQGNNPGGDQIVPMIPGTGSFTITGNAPIGQTVEDQALTNESINYWNTYMPRKAVYVPGSVFGTPSNIHSGLGITYDSENPGNLIVK